MKSNDWALENKRQNMELNYYSDGDNPDHQYGVNIIISSNLETSVIYLPLGDSIMLLKLQISYCVLNIIQAYADEDYPKHMKLLRSSMLISKEPWKSPKRVKSQWYLETFNLKTGSDIKRDIARKEIEGIILSNFGVNTNSLLLIPSSTPWGISYETRFHHYKIWDISHK